MNRDVLWTKNFTIITLGTFVSIVGGTSMNLALSLLVLEETSSTWLSGIFSAASLIPNIVIPFFLAPLVDSYNPKHLIVRLDFITGVLYLFFFVYVRLVGFQYEIYLIFGFLISSGDAVYDLAYQCLYPELIPPGCRQKGYAVSAMLDPLATAVIAPVVATVYVHLGIGIVFLAEGVLLIVAAFFEMQIDYQKAAFTTKRRKYSQDLLEGIRYLKSEKGIRSLCMHMAINNGVSKGKMLMIMAFFHNTHFLTTSMYSFMVSAETFGRFIGGGFHYLIKISPRKKYEISIWIYTLMELCDGILLFMTYPLMLILRFVHGFLGVNSSTIRESAVQNYLPNDMRARVNGVVNVVVSTGMLVVQLLVGTLGEIIPFPYIVTGFSILSMVCMMMMLARNQKHVKRVFCQNL